jgi:hypothetical protein
MVSPMRFGLLVVAGLAALGCGSTPTAPPEHLEPTTTGEAFGGTSCSAVRPPTEPDLMAWDPGSRANLKLLHERGVVAVRYAAAGCNVELEVLNCTGAGTYAFSPYSARETKIAKSARDLFAELPLGAARLEGKVGHGRALRTDYVLAGIFAAPSFDAFPAASLKGTGCERATHVVAKLYVGGFAMAAGEAESLSAGASFFGVGAGASQDRSAERLASEGSPDACDEAQRGGTSHPLCSVPLRVGLVPIAERGAKAAPVEPPVDPAERARVLESVRRALDAQPTAPLPSGIAPSGALDGAKGRLDVAAFPWGQVTVDGRAVGNTPILGLELPPGQHLVVVTNPSGQTAKTKVTILPGQKSSVKLTLSGP